MGLSSLKSVSEKRRRRRFCRGRSLKGKISDHRAKLKALQDQLVHILKPKPGRRGMIKREEMGDCEVIPSFWVSRWFDYSEKYGFGYQLCDDRVGVIYNDSTQLIMLPNKDLCYINKVGSETLYGKKNYPLELEKKVRLLTYFQRYLHRHLIKTGEYITSPDESSQLPTPPHLFSWNRAARGMTMSLSNGIVQVNFTDHSKVIVCPVTSAVTYHNSEGTIKTYRFASLETGGCSEDLELRLKYTLLKITNLTVNLKFSCT